MVGGVDRNASHGQQWDGLDSDQAAAGGASGANAPWGGDHAGGGGGGEGGQSFHDVIIGGQDKKGPDGQPTGARTNIFDEAAWNATNFARVYQAIEALSKRVDDLVNLIEVGASK